MYARTIKTSTSKKPLKEYGFVAKAKILIDLNAKALIAVNHPKVIYFELDKLKEYPRPE